ncbi:hypothetical protein K438DRAFT_1819719 [Mycena galopus ATCC 62051]|nr:hypothetical protein K438DRAFT_1819719 [Mycena galopus ATCC 62051]
MRAITRTVYKGPDFQRALKDQGLFDMLHAIARPGNLLETSHVDVEESFRWYDWKVSYAELIVRWVEPTRTQEEYDKMTPPSNPHFKFSAELAMDLLMFISAIPRMHPWSFNPAAVYMFMSLGCFVANCETWLVPCLRELQYQHLEGWDSEVVYRALIRLPVFQKSSERNEILDRLDARLAAIIRETSDHRQFMKSLTEELYRSRTHLDRSPPNESDQELSPPSESPQNSRHPANLKARKVAQQQQVLQNPGQRAKREVLGAQPKLKKIVRKGCRCEGLPMEHRCIRIIQVKPRKCKHLIGAALTCAPLGDRLRPKPPAKRKKGSKGPARPRRPIQYFHPIEDLEMEVVEHRPTVYKRCGRDIVRFMWRRKDGKEMVGGVGFNVFRQKTLDRLIYNHHLVQVSGIKRRADMQRWAYGTMTAIGSRQPTGGKKGDGYNAYPCMQGRSVGEIKALHRAAMSADIMVEAGNLICPGMRKRIRSLTEQSGINYLGRTGVSHFNCHNYISCVHADLDIGIADLLAGRGKNDAEGDLYSCGQLEKLHCGPNDFNFAYVRWGVMVRTLPNAVWVFNGRHAHGTVMPSASAMQQNAVSRGDHDTAPAVNVLRANKLREIRREYNLRPRMQ